ncbi:molybdate ABC transporter substrate-binding protein [Ramlibacter sp. MMS24-I3-19]|uniref:molybdate ABC transporter substrate-binding protein n=1 Tax=Ramlibacter sp. MMS24-I3-19 TaxID=3416606 RepID=UPI003D00C8E1
MRHPLRAILASAVLALPLAGIAADVKVLTAGAYRQVLLAAQPAFEQRSGHRLVIDNDTAGGLQKRVGGGEAFDVVVSSPASLQPVAAQLASEPPRPLARVGIGVAVKTGATLPDIGSVDAFRALLLRARSVAMVDPAAGGTSGVYLFRLYERLRIADQVRAKAVLVPGGHSAEKVAGGQAEIAIQQMSELLPVQGVTVVGPLPAEVQNYTVYAGALSARAAQPEAARQLLDALRGPEIEPLLKAKGMEAVR